MGAAKETELQSGLVRVFLCPVARSFGRQQLKLKLHYAQQQTQTPQIVVVSVVRIPWKNETMKKGLLHQLINAIISYTSQILFEMYTK